MKMCKFLGLGQLWRIYFFKRKKITILMCLIKYQNLIFLFYFSAAVVTVTRRHMDSPNWLTFYIPMSCLVSWRWSYYCFFAPNYIYIFYRTSFLINKLHWFMNLCIGRGCEHYSQLSPPRSHNDSSHEIFFLPYAYVLSPTLHITWPVAFCYFFLSLVYGLMRLKHNLKQIFWESSPFTYGRTSHR